jgi:acyl-CoA thioesterase FadM
MSEPAAHADAETPRIETREEVMFFDTDCGGVVHNIAYLRMIETARTRLAACWA